MSQPLGVVRLDVWVCDPSKEDQGIAGNRPAQPHEALPKLVKDAYTILGADWREARRDWDEKGHQSPPVMLTVCNRTETAARITA